MTKTKQAAKKATVLDLTHEDLLDMYYHMALARALGDQMWIHSREGKASIAASCDGQEAAQVGSAYALRKGVDWVHPYYRDFGVVLVLGFSPRQILAQSLGRATDSSSLGRQMPGHFADPRLRIVSGATLIGDQILRAVGTALASKIRGEDAVTVTYFGDGAASQGDCHEAMNFAGIHRLPIVFFCENNCWAISTPLSLQVPIPNFADRAAGYGFPGVVVDGMDVLAVYEATKEAVERARRGEGPTFIEAKCYRFSAHTSADDDRRYRDPAEVAEWRKKDPLPLFQAYLRKTRVLDDGTLKAIEERVKGTVEDATQFAESSPYPRVEDVATHVYA